MVWSAILGGLAWTASEYAIHRFIGHGPRREVPKTIAERFTPQGFVAAFNNEHVAHHADPTYFAPTTHKIAAASIGVPILGLAVSPFVGLKRGLAFGAGFGVVYGLYEIAHRRIHTHAPRNAFGRWMRKNHLGHHHRTPNKNHGVTSPVWDHVFGTSDPTERVRIPRVAAPVWMVDEAGELKPAYAADYELVGPVTRKTAPRTRGIGAQSASAP